MSEMFLKKVPKGFLVKSFLKHHVIFAEGSKGDTAFILAQGSVELSGTVDNRKKVFAVLSPPSIFGEMALFLEDQARTATAIALEDSKIVIITKDDLADYMSQAPQVISSILEVLVHRLKTTTKKALRVPNVPMGVCRVLDLFAMNGLMKIKYGSAVRTLSEAFSTSAGKIEKYLEALAARGHLEIAATSDPAKRSIKLHHADFLKRVMEDNR
ncbi:MAG: cyclic nucleotide-binding domain-containing protein [Desulfovibrionaceae bacterium]|nr:cyclic nucleotide-binding domain-containing protein [Desulfovibrionaceae bacterium]MDD4951146.1 cyclic nucleotide-binding domain-containing protein [Desulfovibrionaceae bacterium]